LLLTVLFEDVCLRKGIARKVRRSSLEVTIPLRDRITRGRLRTWASLLVLPVERDRSRGYGFLVSKAFTRESDESGAEETPPVRFQLPPGARNYITREGAARLRENLNQLLAKRRVGVGAGKETDPEAKAEQRRLESALRTLQAKLDSVVVAEPPADPGKVAFGASVVVRHGSGEEEEYQIVGVDESDPAQGRISWISPLARALLGRSAGDKIRFRSPAGDEELNILEVRHGRA
jgi:transcription elongation factor GreB